MRRTLALAASLLIASTGVALAHQGDHLGGFAAGFAHPPGGLDHLLAMVAVGLWAAQLGGRAVWLVPASFLAMMAAGGLLAVAGIALPLVEVGIVGSVLLLGLLIAGAVRLPIQAGMALAGLFALFHGQAHGLEMPATGAPLLYGLGFLAATALLHGLGVAGALGLRSTLRGHLVCASGAGIAAAGALLLLA